MALVAAVIAWRWGYRDAFGERARGAAFIASIAVVVGGTAIAALLGQSLIAPLREGDYARWWPVAAAVFAVIVGGAMEGLSRVPPRAREWWPAPGAMTIAVTLMSFDLASITDGVWSRWATSALVYVASLITLIGLGARGDKVIGARSIATMLFALAVLALALRGALA